MEQYSSVKDNRRLGCSKIPVGVRSQTQQTTENIGLPFKKPPSMRLRSSNATCYPSPNGDAVRSPGTLRANKPRNPSNAVAPQPTQFKVFGANLSVLPNGA